VAKRRKNRRPSDDDDVVRLEIKPDREMQQQWAGLFVPYVYCPHCKHVYTPDDFTPNDYDEPLPVPRLDEDGKPEGAQELNIPCRRCRRSKLVRVLVDFGQVEPFRIGGKQAEALGQLSYFCVCPLCGGACQVRRSNGMNGSEFWGCSTCGLNLRRVWM